MRQRFKRVVIALDAREREPPDQRGPLRPRTGLRVRPRPDVRPVGLPAEVESTPLRGAAAAARCSRIDTHSGSRTGESGVPPFADGCMLTPSPLSRSALRKGRTHAPLA